MAPIPSMGARTIFSPNLPAGSVSPPAKARGIPMLLSDETLYAQAKDGDMRAFDALYARYEACLFGFIISQVRNRADAEDLFHEAFVNALKAPAVRFQGEGG